MKQRVLVALLMLVFVPAVLAQSSSQPAASAKAAAPAAAPAPTPPPLELPRPSPKATVTQTVGLTEVTIAYCRPGVKGRAIWGSLVPYDQVWRTGANEATTITFSDDVSIEGTKLAAGTYGLFTLPGKDEWSFVFNKDAKQWGAYEYKQASDVLRIKAKPQASDFNELMTFSFTSAGPEIGEVTLAWEKLKVSFTFNAGTTPKVLAAARKAVALAKADDWRTTFRAASFCIDNNVNLDEAGAWIDQSIKAKETYYNLLGKAKLLAARGQKADAVVLAKKAIEVGNAAQPKNDVAPAELLLKEWQK